MHTADHLFFSVFVIAELKYGFRLDNRQQHNETILDLALTGNNISVVQTSLETAEIYSEIKAALKLKIMVHLFLLMIFGSQHMPLNMVPFWQPTTSILII